jgi:simple sugar transport system ATP-binding protein
MDFELKHVHKRFGLVHANDDISVTFRGGRIVGVLGENGAGKSTLMKILSGFQPMDSGEIFISGQRANYHGPQAAIASGIGMLQQDPLDIPAFTVIENFLYGQRGGLLIGRRKGRQQLAELCRRFGFDLDPDTPITQLSIGQRQQLEIVRLLALGVKTLILDEPTTGISAEQKAILFDTLRELARQDGMSVLLVSHKLNDVIALCDEVVVLRAGKLVGDLQMPATTRQLVTLMFGQELGTQTREPVMLGEPKVKLDHVMLRDKRVEMEDFSLNIQAGEVIGLAGLEGSGQELVIRCCVGLVKPSQGHVFIDQQDMTGRPYRHYLRCGVAFGAAGRLEEGLVAGLTLTEHVALTEQTGQMLNWGRARERTDSQLKHYNVRGRPESRVEELSGGNQQRLLMALLPQQAVLLALEQPTRGLDVDSARWIWQQLLARRSSGTAILFTSPDLDELVAYSDRIFVFYAGSAIEIPDASRTTIDELGRLIGGHFEEYAV